MTREEARTALGDRNNLLWGMSKEEQKYYSEALDIAIASLKTDEAYQLEYENRDFVEITKGMTNGEILKAVFPNMKVHEYTEKVVLNGLGDEFQIQSMAWKNWWDSPYKGVSE